MPFKKVGKDDYTSPSGRHFNEAQVRLWHARGGKFPGQKGPGEMNKYAKGGDVRKASYAKGGAVIGQTSQFMKTPDNFRSPNQKVRDFSKMADKSMPPKRTGGKNRGR